MAKPSAPKSAALPRGLRVFKMRKPGLPPRDLATLPAGRKPWDVWPDDYQPDYYYRIEKIGWPSKKGTTGRAVFRDAVQWARQEWELIAAAKDATRTAAVAALLGGKRTVCLLSEIFQHYKDGPEFVREADRLPRELRKLIAMARGWWKEGDPDMRDKSDLARRIDALPADVVTESLVREYFAAAQGGKYKPTDRSRANITINRRLRMARQLFTPRAMKNCYDGLTLPDVAGFMAFPLLPQVKIDLEDEMIAEKDYTAMLDAADAMERGDETQQELALVNRMLRELGLRNGELVAARADWLERDARTGQWLLVMKHRPAQGYTMKGAEPGRLPLSEDLLAMLGARIVWDVATRKPAYLIQPDGLPTVRFNFVNRAHTAWLKTIIGEIHSGKVNHRLRKYVATMIALEEGVAVASQYLRHASETVTLKHYIARMSESLPTITDARLRAGLRVWRPVPAA